MAIHWSPLTLLPAWGAGPLQALSAHLPADNSAQAQHTEEILKQLRQMQEQVSLTCILASHPHVSLQPLFCHCPLALHVGHALQALHHSSWSGRVPKAHTCIAFDQRYALNTVLSLQHEFAM